MPSVRDDVEVALHEHRFLVTKLLEALSTAALPPSTITATRLRTVNETFGKVLEKDRELLAAVKKLARHQVAQKELAAVQEEISKKKLKVVRYAAQLRRSQEKHQTVLQHAKQKTKVVLDPRDIVAYAHRIAGTTSAPREWRPGFPMFGFMPPAPQPHMMRAGVLSRGVVAETVTQEPEKYSSSAASRPATATESLEKLTTIPIGLGASDAQIRKQMPPGWNPGDPVDLPLDALLHYMGRSFFTVVDDVEGLRKRRKLGDDDAADDSGTATGNETGSGKDDDDDDSESDSDSSDSDSDKDTVQKISLSLSSDDDSDDASD
ncbi:hypothetical protein PybrP1_010767 [[Pythium] brassicae (nom. inval.)]|nr:hypothetical protein PybrP1_010767 [[Pythium] brassicae (nom. inval.)]